MWCLGRLKVDRKDWSDSTAVYNFPFEWQNVGRHGQYPRCNKVQVLCHDCVEELALRLPQEWHYISNCQVGNRKASNCPALALRTFAVQGSTYNGPLTATHSLMCQEHLGAALGCSQAEALLLPHSFRLHESFHPVK